MTEENSKELVQAEKEVALNGHAVYSNRVLLVMSDGVMRITFAEQLGEEVSTQFRSAVAMPLATAYGLRDALDRLLIKLDADLKKEIVQEENQDAE